YPDLEARERTLLEAHGKAWCSALPRLLAADWFDFRRGFAEGVGVGSWKAFHTQAETIFAAAPVECVSFGRLTPRTVMSLASSPLLGRSRRLSCPTGRATGRSGRVDDEGLQTLVNSPHLGRLVELDLYGSQGAREGPGPAGAWALAESLSLKGLKS